MFVQTDAKKNLTAGLTPPVSPRTPWRVKDVVALPELKLCVRFIDDLEGILERDRQIHSEKAGVFAVLANPARFNKVRIENSAVTWPVELDLAPDAMHAVIKKKGVWVL